MRKSHLIGIGLILLALIVVARYANIHHYFSIRAIQNKEETLVRFVQERYTSAVFWFIVAYALIIMVALPGFAPLTMGGGYLFGTIPGAFYALSGVFLGSSVAFFGIRLFLRGFVIKHYPIQLARFREYADSYGIANTLILLHFLTIIPFVLINAFAAVTDIPTFTFLWTTLVGSLPLIIFYAFAGSKLQEIDTIADIFSPKMMILFALLIFLALAPILIKKFQMRLQK